MKHIKSYKIFESLSGEVSIDEFITKIGIDTDKKPLIIDWWNQNREGFKIYYFPFSCFEPIAGVFLDVDTVCINQNMNFRPFMKLFIALHESRHADQHREERFMSGYFDTVIENKKDEFLEAYKELEKDANDFAIQSMIECGFGDDMNRFGYQLRSNENSGRMVWDLMKRDIQKFKPIDFIDLLKKQIF